MSAPPSPPRRAAPSETLGLLRRALGHPFAPLALLIGGSLALRLATLSGRPSHIDESFYSVAVEIGNVFYITGDVYLWPAISHAAHAVGGIAAARLVTVLYGTATVYFVYRFASPLLRGWSGERSGRRAALLGAALFSISTTALHTSTTATYNAQAFLLFAVALSLLTEGLASEDRTWRWVVAALALSLAAASRFILIPFAFVGVCLAAYVGAVRRRGVSLLAFFVALATALGGYLAFAGDHVMAAIEQSTLTTTQAGASLDQWDVWGHVVRCAAPSLVLGAVGVGVVLVRLADEGVTSGRRLRTLLELGLLAGGAAGMVVFHLRGTHILTMESNLALTALFACVPAGLALERGAVVGRGLLAPGRFGDAIAAIALAAVLVLGAARSRGQVVREQAPWPDWAPVVDALRELGVEGAPEIWCTAASGGVGNVWHLRRELGAAVDQGSPWRAPSPDGVVEQARERTVPVVVGPLPGEDLAVGARYRGYLVAAVVHPRPGPTVFVLTDPRPDDAPP